MKFLYSATSASILGLFTTAFSEKIFSCECGYQILESDVIAAARNIDLDAKIYKQEASNTDRDQSRFQLDAVTYADGLYQISAIIYIQSMTVRVIQVKYRTRQEKFCDLIEGHA
ncbi:CSEP0095 putative effector protein [Blumeria hordei DH14]|uniref:CSEP0095 putative effector protein n=1 Tax=Blumeria graminis f. sp. hordei (strain DH14) TaxID=546991 RepID=N1J8S4_BLUG1|nr:CSEP0095 putative effector protein [Blumeria hordei DH14]